MIQETPIKKFELTLVKSPASNIIFFVAIMASTALAISIPLILTFQFGFTKSIWNFLILSGIISFLFWKYGHKLYLRYNSTISIYDNYFTVDNQKYYWNQIEWYRGNHGGNLCIAFDIGIHKIKSPLRFFIESIGKNNNNFHDFFKMRRAILNGIYDHGVQTRNYYDTKFHRRLARVVLTSNLVLLAVLLALEVKINYALPFFLFWAISSLPYPIIIFSKQDVEVYKD